MFKLARVSMRFDFFCPNEKLKKVVKNGFCRLGGYCV